MTGGSAPPGSQPLVSILLLSWNTRELTLACLDSLPQSIDGDLDYEVIVVDNASVDGSAEALEERAGIVLIRNQENRGYAAAVNQAFAVARGSLILLLNSDAVFAPGALSRLVGFLDRCPTAAGVGPLYLNPDGSQQAHHFRFPTFAMTLASGNAAVMRLRSFRRRFERYKMLDVDFDRPTVVPQPSATCLLLRRDVLRGDELMDERYPIFFNDVALARSLAARGLTLWMTPDAVVYHEPSSSTRQLGSSLKRQYVASVVRYLLETEPRYRVLLYQALVLVQGALLRIARRPRALPLGQLWSAVRGHPGPIPQAPQAARLRRDLQEALDAGSGAPAPTR
jgi:GT2 family glycosyltransferase